MKFNNLLFLLIGISFQIFFIEGMNFEKLCRTCKTEKMFNFSKHLEKASMFPEAKVNAVIRENRNLDYDELSDKVEDFLDSEGYILKNKNIMTNQIVLQLHYLPSNKYIQMQFDEDKVIDAYYIKKSWTVNKT